MAFITIDKPETTDAKSGKLKTFFSSIMASIRAYRKERNELRKLRTYHTKKDADLARAKRDVNQIWY
jgi:hypothetical protein